MLDTCDEAKSNKPQCFLKVKGQKSKDFEACVPLFIPDIESVDFVWTVTRRKFIALAIKLVKITQI